MIRKQPIVPTFVNSFVLVLVANVPEGLPATIASCLQISAKRMAARNVMLKRTNIIETLGACSVIGPPSP